MADPKNMISEATTLPPNKRYILSHDASGKSIIHSQPPQKYWGMPAVGGVARSYSTASVPVKMKDDEDVKAYLADDGATSYTASNIVSPSGGSNLIVVELAPGGRSPMHRTVSIDYSICTNGHVRMELDTGEMIDLYPGDHVIQRGTNHKWWNGSDTEPARFVAVTLPSEPFEIPGTGKTLEEHHVPGSEAKDWTVSKL